jgi:hypothetical protein
MSKKYELRATYKNSLDQQLFMVFDTEANEVVKADLISRDAALFIENLTLLEEVKDYLDKKCLDTKRLNELNCREKIPQEYAMLLEHPWNHDVEAMALRTDRLLNSLKNAEGRAENYKRAEELIRKLSNLNTVKAADPLLKRLKRAYYLFKTL